MAFVLISQAQGVSGKNESTQTPWREAQCSCIGCIGLRPALATLHLFQLRSYVIFSSYVRFAFAYFCVQIRFELWSNQRCRTMVNYRNSLKRTFSLAQYAALSSRTLAFSNVSTRFVTDVLKVRCETFSHLP